MPTSPAYDPPGRISFADFFSSRPGAPAAGAAEERRDLESFMQIRRFFSDTGEDRCSAEPASAEIPTPSTCTSRRSSSVPYNDLEDFLQNSLFKGKSDEFDDDYVPNLTRREFESILSENLGILIKSEDVIDEMFAECSNESNREDRRIEINGLMQYIMKLEMENSEAIDHFKYVSFNSFTSLTIWMTVFFVIGAVLGTVMKLIKDPIKVDRVDLSSCLFSLVGALVFAFRVYEQVADRFDHVLLAKRMILRWYRQFFVFHLKTGPKKVSNNGSLKKYHRRAGVVMKIDEDVSDRISFTDFFRPNSLSGEYLDKLQEKQGVNMVEFTLLLEASSIFIQKDIMRDIFLEMDLDESGKIDLQELEKFAKKTDLKDQSEWTKHVSVLRKCIRSWLFWSECLWFVGAILYLIETQHSLGQVLPEYPKRWLTLIGAWCNFYAGATLIPKEYSDTSRYFTRIAELQRALLKISISEGKIAREESLKTFRPGRKNNLQEVNFFYMLNPSRKRRKSSLKRDSFVKNIFFSYNKWVSPGSTQSVKENSLQQDEENRTAVGLDCWKLHNILFQNGILIELDIFTRMFQKADINGDGNISFEEFSKFTAESNEAEEISSKYILSEVLRRSDFYIAVTFVVAGILKFLFEYCKMLNTPLNSTLAKIALGVPSSAFYAMCASVGVFQKVGNLSSKFYTMQNCKIRFCDAIIMGASKYSETIDHKERMEHLWGDYII